jgi:hypothetical protein
MPVDARPQVRKNRRRIHRNTLRGFQGENDAGACRSFAAAERLGRIGFVERFSDILSTGSYFLGPHGKEAMSAHADAPAWVAENAEVVAVAKLNLRAPGCSANDAPAHCR